jgi:hypothetical protein
MSASAHVIVAGFEIRCRSHWRPISYGQRCSLLDLQRNAQSCHWFQARVKMAIECE